jgi:hypothetical protein
VRGEYPPTSGLHVAYKFCLGAPYTANDSLVSILVPQVGLQVAYTCPETRFLTTLREDQWDPTVGGDRHKRVADL